MLGIGIESGRLTLSPFLIWMEMTGPICRVHVLESLGIQPLDVSILDEINQLNRGDGTGGSRQGARKERGRVVVN